MNIKNVVEAVLSPHSRFSVCVIALGLLGSASAVAQELRPPPDILLRDEVGVDLSSGHVTTTLNDLSIGSGVSALSHTIASFDGSFGAPLYGFWDDFIYEKNFQLYDHWTVVIGRTSTTFKESNGLYTPIKQDGTSLVENPNGSTTFTSKDGLKVTGGTRLYPNGFEVTVHYYAPPGGGGSSRVQSVTTNSGLQFKYDYASDSYASDNSSRSLFYRPTVITALNNGIDYCNPTAHSCSYSQTWPSVTYDWPSHTQIYGDPTGGGGVPNTFTVTDAGGRVTTFKQESFPKDAAKAGPFYEPRISEVIQSTSSGPITTSFEYDHRLYCVFLSPAWDCTTVQSNVAAAARRGNAVWTYDYVAATTQHVTIETHTSFGPEYNVTATLDSYESWHGGVLPTQVSGVGGSINFSQDSVRRRVSASYSAGNSATFEYDGRGNMTKRTDSADGAITKANFVTCTAANFKWCNKPTWIEDASNNRTDYEYGDAHGMITKVTQPAPEVGTNRPQTRYFYNQYYAWYKNSSGVVAQAPTPIWLLQKESTCVLGAASGNGCANPNYERTVEYDYGIGSSSQPNNSWLRGRVVRAYKSNFTTLETQRTCYQYDALGNQIAETRPAANLSSCN